MAYRPGWLVVDPNKVSYDEQTETLSTENLAVGTGVTISEFSTDSAADSTSSLMTSSAIQEALFNISSRPPFPLPSEIIANSLVETQKSFQFDITGYSQETQFNVGGNLASSRLVQALPNGNVAVMIGDVNANDNATLSIYSSDGTALNTYTFPQTTVDSSYFSMDILQEGYIVAAYTSNFSGTPTVHFQVLDQSGNALSSNQTVTPLASGTVLSCACKVLSDNTFAIVWGDLLGGTYFSRFRYKSGSLTTIVNAQLLSPTVLVDVLNTIKLIELPNGNIFISGNNFTGPAYYYGIFDKEGTAIQDFASIYTGGLNSDNLILLPSKDILLSVITGDTRDFVYWKFDIDGNILENQITFKVASLSFAVNSVVLPNGNIFHSYLETNPSNEFYQIITDQDMNIISESTISETVREMKLSLMNYGQIAMIYHDNASATFLRVYEGTGTKINGTLSLQSGVPVNEITTDSASDSTTVLMTSSAIQDALSGAGGGLFTEDANGNIFGGTGAAANLTGSSTDSFYGGVNAGNAVTTAFWNVVLGEEAMLFNQTGSGNTCLGFQSGYGLSSQSYTANTFVGYWAGRNARSSQGNTALGHNALSNLTTGDNNVGIGRLAGETGTTITGDENTFVGYRAGQSITSGGFNVAVGAYAGYGGLFGSGGSRNVCIGYEAGRNESAGSDKLFIGNNSSESLIEGDFAARTLTINGSLTVTDATSITLASTVLSEPTPGTLEIDGQPIVTGSAGSTTLAGLTDVTITAPSNNEVLTYSGGQWVNAASSGGGGGGASTILLPQEAWNNGVHTLQEFAQIETIGYVQTIAPTNFDGTGGSYGKATPLLTGDFFIAYYDGSQGRFQVRSSDGSVVVAATTFTNDTVKFLDVCTLPDGRVFLVYESTTNSDVRYAVISEDGTILFNTIWDTSMGSYVTCAAFPNGRVLAAGANSGDEKGQYQIFSINLDGTTVAETAILDFTTSEAGEMRATTMQNGNVLVAFHNVSGSDGEFVIFDSDGTIIVSPTDFDSNNVDSLDVCTTRSGKAFIFSYVDFTEVLGVDLVENDGTIVSSFTYDSGTYSTANQAVSCTQLPDGNIMLSYINSADTSILTAIIDEGGSTVLAEATVFTTTNIAVATAELATSKDGSVFFGFSEVDTETDDGKYAIYQGEGTKVNGYLELQNGTKVNEISSDQDASSSIIIMTSDAIQDAIAAGGGGGSGLFSEDSDNNIIGGTGAGANLTGGSGTNNFFGGVSAGNNTTTGDRNLFMGNNAGDGNSTGSNNVALGIQALRGTTANPANCIAIGYQAMSSMVTASSPNSNIAIGFQALLDVGNGSSNIAMGASAGNSITTGNNNVIIGDSAGISLTTESGNLFLGHNAGQNDTGSNKLLIANNSTEALIEGDFSARTAQVNGRFSAEQNQIFNGSVVTTDTTADFGEVILVNAASGAVTVDLIYVENAHIIVKKIDSSSNAVTIQGNDGKTIDGASTKSTTTQYASFTFFGFNDEWHII